MLVNKTVTLTFTGPELLRLRDVLVAGGHSYLLKVIADQFDLGVLPQQCQPKLDANHSAKESNLGGLNLSYLLQVISNLEELMDGQNKEVLGRVYEVERRLDVIKNAFVDMGQD